ncbi:hypothetical protein KBZ10_20475 [Streptomyces sp. F63]|uniref:hypothetical protein n=1 Tax=Streptomyces sp. F63 TaxID=2824887 RepID=UPI001B3583B5|nr:hypothetical protein [Streptomyces sp. F63]MBQ0986844.1 hypothetical protein [Streptomyces sp. F63]
MSITLSTAPDLLLVAAALVLMVLGLLLDSAVSEGSRSWLRHRVVRPYLRLRAGLVRSFAGRLIRDTREVLLPVVGNRVATDPYRIPLCITHWWKSLLATVPFRLLVFVVVPVVILNGAAEAWILFQSASSFRGSLSEARSEFAEAVHLFVDKAREKVGAPVAEYLGDPVGSLGAVRVSAMLLLLLLAVFLTARPLLASVLHSGSVSGDEAPHPLDSAAPGRRYWPVVVLVAAAVQSARACRKWEARTRLGTPPRISLRVAERVIRRAYRTRNVSARRHHRRHLRAHAAHVIGALRAVEVRQDRDSAAAYHDLAVMLLTIAERYAEGRIGELLDEADLVGVEPVVDRAGLRFAAAGAVVLGVLGAASWGGVPAEVMGPLLGVTATAAVVLAYGMGIPRPSDLVDIVRGADRR